MDEKIIIKGKRKSSISIFVGFIVAGIVAFLSYFLYSVNSYRSYAYISPAGTRSTKTIPWGEAISESIRYDGGLPFVAIGVVIFIIIGYIIYKNWSKIEMTVSDKRVYGINAVGKRVDLPLDSISAVGTSAFRGIAVTTSSGAIKFNMLENRDEVQSAISGLLIDRQNKTNCNEQAANSGKYDADELKKFKELLDSGVITQEEFDVKKKQLLGL